MTFQVLSSFLAQSGDFVLQLGVEVRVALQEAVSWSW